MIVLIEQMQANETRATRAQNRAAGSFRQTVELSPLTSHAGLDVTFPDDLPEDLQKAALKALPDPSNHEPPEGAEILKSARQRLVLRLGVPPILNGSCVAKLFPLKNPMSRLRHRKYARREYLNLLTARAFGMPVPRPLAFFQRRRFGLVAGSGLLLEDLRHHRSIANLADEIGSYSTAARYALPALIRLYCLGINHVDARDENILIARDTTDGQDFVVIDWQYANFPAARAPWLLEHLAAYFIRMAPEDAQKKLMQDWLTELHAKAEATSPITGFIDRVTGLIASRPSTKARLRLAPAV